MHNFFLSLKFNNVTYSKIINLKAYSKDLIYLSRMMRNEDPYSFYHDINMFFTVIIKMPMSGIIS